MNQRLTDSPIGMSARVNDGAGDMAAGARELAVEDRHHARPLLLRGLDLARVMEGRVLAHDRREGVAPGAVELGRLPVDPAVDLGARLRLGRQQRFGRPFVGEIADDAVALPQHEVAVDDHRHQAVGILRQLRAVVGARVGDADLLAGPQDLAHVDRRGLAEDAQASEERHAAAQRHRLAGHVFVADQHHHDLRALLGRAEAAERNARRPTRRPRRTMSVWISDGATAFTVMPSFTSRAA